MGEVHWPRSPQTSGGARTPTEVGGGQSTVTTLTLLFRNKVWTVRTINFPASAGVVFPYNEKIFLT